MAYRDFKTLAQAKKAFALTTVEKSGIFAVTPPVKQSDWLAETLQYNLPLALASNSEKARSELIISPILIEVHKKLNARFSLFSGVDFTVDESKGLNGNCDFILSNAQESLFIASPVMMIVEAKNDNVKNGLGQCVAEMVAARIFNQREGNETGVIYGSVTTGTTWIFLRLIGEQLEIDLSEYYLVQIEQILGILTSFIHLPEQSTATVRGD